jgi:hypothetical protein
MAKKKPNAKKSGSPPVSEVTAYSSSPLAAFDETVDEQEIVIEQRSMAEPKPEAVVEEPTEELLSTSLPTPQRLLTS